MASTWGSSWGTSWGTSWDLAFATVPDVTGLTQAQAVAAIEGAGFVAAVITASSDTVLEGLVISQDPLGGASAASGATVTITVSTGAGVDPLDPKYLGRSHNTQIRWLRKKKEEPPEPELPVTEPPAAEPAPSAPPARGRGLKVSTPAVEEPPKIEVVLPVPKVVVPIRPAAPPPPPPPPPATKIEAVVAPRPAAAKAAVPAAPAAPPAPQVSAPSPNPQDTVAQPKGLVDVVAALQTELAALRKLAEGVAAQWAIRDRDERNRRRAAEIAAKLLKDDDESS